MPKPTRADLERSLECERERRDELDAVNQGNVKAGQEWKEKAGVLERDIADLRKRFTVVKNGLKQEIHSLELRLARANGYIDKIKDDHLVASGKERIVHPEIREPIRPHGPGEEFAPGVPDRDRFDRHFHSTVRDETAELNKPWWMR
jgi:hypothetical protein